MSRPFAYWRRAGRAAILALPALALLQACSKTDEITAPDASFDSAEPASIVSLPAATNQIMDIVDAVTAAWAAKDATAYAAPYAVDAQLVSPLGGLMVGREAFRNQHVFLFNGPFAGSTQTIAVRDIIFLSGTNALVLQDVTLTGYAFLPPGLPSANGVVRNRAVWGVEKRAGKWEIVFQQMTPQL